MPVDVVLCVHHHLPVGELDSAFEEAYREAWSPLLEALERHPRVRCALHLGGAVLDWLALRHPEHLDRLRALARRARVEPITGGHYAPALAALPEVDRIGQIQRLSRALEQVTGSRPETIWLADDAWEPHLPPTLRAAGVEGAVVSDTLLARAGLPPGPRPDYYLTEDLGQVIALFPVVDWLEGESGSGEAPAVLDRLREALAGTRAADGGPPLAALAAPPVGTTSLEPLFAALESAAWLEPVTFAEHRRRAAPAGRVYLAQPPATSWRGALAASPDADALHKKMLRVSRKVEAAARHDPAGAAGFREALYRAQCRDAYLPPGARGARAHVRSAAFRNLVAAERAADEVLAACRPGPLRAFPWGGDVRGPCVLETGDLDADGLAEAAVESAPVALLVDPARGGGIVEFDVRDRAFNLLDTGRPAFMEHFLGPEATLDSFAAGGDAERGPFAERPYEWTVLEAPPVAESEIPSDPEPEPPRIRLARRAAVRGDAGEPVPVLVVKTLRHDGTSASLKAAYLVENEGLVALDTTFAVEVSLNLLAARAPDRYYRLPGGVDLPERYLASQGAVAGVTAVEVVDEWLPLTVRLECDEPAEWWRLPVPSPSPAAYRGSILLLRWRIRLAPGGRFRVQVTLEVMPTA